MANDKHLKRNTGFTAAFLAEFVWGTQSLYYSLIGCTDQLLILSFRIVFSALTLIIICFGRKNIKQVFKLFSSRENLKLIIPTVLMLWIDWMTFIIAARTNRILDASLGYFLCPIITFLYGLIFFKEKCRKTQLVALGFIVIGIIFSLISLHTFPILALVVSFNWATYSAWKKKINIDPIVESTGEAVGLIPFALVVMMIFKPQVLSAQPAKEILLMAGTGLLSVIPLTMYSLSVAKLPLITICLFQYMAPILSTTCGFILGETLSVLKLTSFLIIMVGVVIYAVITVRDTIGKTTQ